MGFLSVGSGSKTRRGRFCVKDWSSSGSLSSDMARLSVLGLGSLSLLSIVLAMTGTLGKIVSGTLGSSDIEGILLVVVVVVVVVVVIVVGSVGSSQNTVFKLSNTSISSLRCTSKILSHKCLIDYNECLRNDIKGHVFVFFLLYQVHWHQ